MFNAARVASLKELLGAIARSSRLNRPGRSPAGQGLCTHVNRSMACVSPYELGNVAAFVYEAAKGSPGDWSSPQPKCPSLAPHQGSGPVAAVWRTLRGYVRMLRQPGLRVRNT